MTRRGFTLALTFIVSVVIAFVVGSAGTASAAPAPTGAPAGEVFEFINQPSCGVFEAPSGLYQIQLGNYGMVVSGVLPRGSLQPENLEDYERVGVTYNTLTDRVVRIDRVMMPGAQSVDPEYCDELYPGDFNPRD